MALKPEVVIALAAVFVAVVALGVAIWQGILARQHQRLSVKPILEAIYNTHRGEDVSVVLSNRGTGPAVIPQFDFVVDGEKRFHPTPSGTLAMVQFLDLPVSCRLDVPSGKAALAPGDALRVFEFPGTAEDPSLHDRVVRIIPRIYLEVHYFSIYGEKFDLERLDENSLVG